MNELSRETHHSGERSKAKYWAAIYPKNVTDDISNPFFDTFEGNRVITEGQKD